MENEEEYELGRKTNTRFLIGFIAFLLILLFIILLLYIYPKLSISNSCLYLSKEIAEAIMASVLTSGLTWLFFFLVFPKHTKGMVKILKNTEIKKYHKKCRKGISEWWYDGGTGCFTREKTLPELANDCFRDGNIVSVNIFILNPQNDKLCEAYAGYSNSFFTKGHPQETVNDIKNNLLATIVAAYFWKKRSANLNIEIYLKNHFSIFKKELSNKMVLITRDDPQKPGIVFSDKTDFYEGYKQDLLKGKKMAVLVEDMEFDFTAEKYSEITIDDVERLLTLLKFTVAPENLHKILYYIKHKTSRFNQDPT